MVVNRISHSALTTLALLACCVLGCECLAQGEEFAFDVPSSIECRDVTTQQFAAANPRLKLIEAKVRISAREDEGSMAEAAQFDYQVRTGGANRVVDYFPKTQLESAVVQDQIAVTASAEDSRHTVAKVTAPGAALALGATFDAAGKTSEAKTFKQFAAKDVVLASGTIEREHGVFFHVRPSRSAALEGSREFVVIVAVPRGWRGGVCEIVCSARLNKRTLLAATVVSTAESVTPVGMYLTGDPEAAATAEAFRQSQAQYQAVVAAQVKKPSLIKAISTNVLSLGGEHHASHAPNQTISQASQSLLAIQTRLQSLSAAMGGVQ